MMAAVGFLALRGTPAIERFLASLVVRALRRAYGVFFVWCWTSFGDAIAANLDRIRGRATGGSSAV